DNNCTIEFDAFSSSVKHFLTRHILLRCDSLDDLCHVTKPSTTPTAFLSTSASTWHQRLGHLGDEVLRSLVSRQFISCKKEKSSHFCHACQLGKHSMTPSSPPSYQFLKPTPSSSLLHHTLHDPTTHTYDPTAKPQPNTHTPPITDLTQSPPDTGPNSPGLTFPTNQPTSHELHNTQTQTQNSPLPPPIFDPPNPQTNTDLVNEPPCTHPMITRWQSGNVKPIDRLSLNTFLISSIPKKPHDVLKDPQWRNVVYDEYNALVKNGTWLLVPMPAGVNMIRSMWLFKHKFHADGTLCCFKACLVSNGSSQQIGVDFDKTFSLVVKPTTIRTVLSLAVSRKWSIHQIDVKNSFLNGDLSETVYMHQPPVLLMLGGLQYLTFARLDFSYVVQQVCLYMYDPREPHFAALYRILRFIRGTMDFGFQLYAFATTSLVGYTDADCVAKHQHTLSRYSAEAKYRCIANVVAETSWLRNLLRESHSPLPIATLVYCDNVRWSWRQSVCRDLEQLIGSGGMPPSHFAAVTALAVTVGLHDGLGGSIFATALILACIIMYDATSEGLQAGRQADVCLFLRHCVHVLVNMSIIRVKICELLGHTLPQVCFNSGSQRMMLLED
nr:ribonuclease H-like domain-containing protein [Tanacetum cinerariifolium]